MWLIFDDDMQERKALNAQAPIGIGNRVMVNAGDLSGAVGVIVDVKPLGETDIYSVLVNGRRRGYERREIATVQPCQGYQDCAFRHRPEQCSACNPETTTCPNTRHAGQ